MAILITYGLTTWSDITNPDNEEAQLEPLVIELYAKQFQWTARYSGEDNILGSANVRNIEGANTVGIDPQDANSFDDIVAMEQLVLPKGRPVLFKFRSQDVIHSAYMPHFRAQMNCVPGMVTQFQFTPTISTEEMRAKDDIQERVSRINEIRELDPEKDPYEFDFVLLCNKICGAAHYNMRFPIKVVEPAEFDEWYSEQSTFSEL